MRNVDLKPYLDEISREVTSLTKESQPKTDSDWEMVFSRLEQTLRGQSRRMAAELGLAGDPTILFMLTTGLLSISWAAFAIKRGSEDTNQPFEENLEMVELFSQISNTVQAAVESASAYADIYKK